MKARAIIGVASLCASTIVLTTVATPVAASSLATNIVATPGDERVRLDWAEPGTPPNGYSLLGFYVNVRDTEDNLIERKECSNATGTDESCNITGDIDGDTGGDDSTDDDLQNGVTYRFSVTPRWVDSSNVEQAGEESERIEATPRTVPDAPTSAVASYGSSDALSTDAVPTASATVAWAKPSNGGATIDAYSVVVTDTEGTAVGPDGVSTTTADNETGCDATGADTLQCSVSGLVTNTALYFTVTAQNVAGSSEASSVSTRLITPPGPPTITSVTLNSSGLRVLWTAPTGAASILGYTATAATSDSTVVSTANWTSGSLGLTLEGLTENTEYTVSVTAQNGSSYDGNDLGTGFGATAVYDQTVTYSSGSFTRLDKPERLMDTRPTGSKVGEIDGSGSAYTLQVTGQKGVPSSGVAAVALNVTVVDGETNDSGGFVTVYPCGTRPDASNLNFTYGQTIPNSVIAPVSSSGQVCFYVYGKAHLLADVSGYFSSGFSPLDKPERLMDTRPTGSKVGEIDGSGSAYTLQVTGQKGVPSSGVAAVALNVTVVDGETNDSGGFVTVYPCGTRPDASNLNFTYGQTIPNSVIAPVSSSGQVCFYVYGKAHLLADVSGYFSG